MSYISRNQPAFARVGEFLTDDQIRVAAPSAFANTAHELRSSVFTVIPTCEVLRELRSEGFEVVQAGQSSSRDASKRAHTKHLLRLRHRAQTITSTSRALGDVFPEVSLVNANDGSSSYVLSAGLFRLICLNGMTTSERAFAPVRVTHQGDVISKVIEGTYTVLNDSVKALEHAEHWQAVNLDPTEIVAFGEAARVLRFGDTEGRVTSPITAATLLTPRRVADSGRNLWNVFNRVQENMIAGGLRGTARSNDGRTRRVRTQRITGIDQDQRLNRALWTLAEALAERH